LCDVKQYVITGTLFKHWKRYHYAQSQQDLKCQNTYCRKKRKEGLIGAGLVRSAILFLVGQKMVIKLFIATGYAQARQMER
jgi:hypothetical protein